MQNDKPFLIKPPETRWAPGKQQLEEVHEAYEKLLPPLVYKIRKAVTNWRESGYSGCSNTTEALLNYWFNKEHKTDKGQFFQYFFAQREAIESIIYLYEIAQAHDKFELMKFDSSGRVSAGMFDENWPRYVIKMATGTGKTKVLGLVLIWAYFNSLYENDIRFSRNFLVIAPNIIVLNRIRKDFDGFNMFFNEPFLPDEGYCDKNWKTDFQLTLHIQDELKPISDNGNIFLTNIHRVYLQEDEEPSVEEMFLGKKPKPDADTSRGMDLGKVLRSNKIKDLMIMNDEAHHIHDDSLQWFKSIEDINNKIKLKTGNSICLQLDTTATPKHNNGAIFTQTIVDYPLVEAIWDNIVKTPVLPDEASREKIEEKDSSEFIERYKDFIHLGYLEWEKQYHALKNSKTPILFIMTMSTKEADEAATFLEKEYALMKNAVLTIHTNKSGEVKETATNKRALEELEKLRKDADLVDSDTSPYRAVCSVLMLREGWDVRNVTTIVGLRPFNAKSNILPEQAIGRGLRKMYELSVNEKLVVIGTPAFIEFVESLKTEGVEFQYSPMGKTGGPGKNPIIIEVDKENDKKDLDSLDIAIPQLTPRIIKEYKKIDEINIDQLEYKPAAYKQFNNDELKEIVFQDIDGKFSHKTEFKNNVTDYRNVIGFITNNILKESRLFNGFSILYPKVEAFIKYKLFGREIALENPQSIRNLAELEPKMAIYNAFKKAINELTITDKGTAKVKNHIALRNTKPKIASEQPFLIPKKSVFNKIIGDNAFELEFAAFLEEKCDDITAFAKNIMGEGGVNFKIEYQSEDGNIREYFPDFFVKKDNENIFIIETKGREEVNDRNKIKRLINWCADVNKAQKEIIYKSVYIMQEEWKKHKNNIKKFKDIQTLFSI
ncbi:MAG: DEAD/DEAH box helicase family protein [Bacteroidota bacterium]